MFLPLINLIQLIIHNNRILLVVLDCIWNNYFYLFFAEFGYKKILFLIDYFGENLSSA